MTDEVLISASISRRSRWGYQIRISFEYPKGPHDVLPPIGMELVPYSHAFTLRGAIRKSERLVDRETRKKIGSGERVVASRYVFPSMIVGDHAP